MPHKLPDEISQNVKTQIPPTYKMWWIRGIVLGARPYVYTKGEKLQVPRTIVQVGDVDMVGEGYDVILESEEFDFADGDLVSLFGHEPAEAGIISSARFFIHHNTGVYTPAYADVKGNQNWNNFGELIAYKKRLACQVPTDAAETNKKIAMIFGIPLLLIWVLSGGDLIHGLVVLFYLLFICACFVGYALLPRLLGQKIAAQVNASPRLTKGVEVTPKRKHLADVSEYFRYKHVNLTSLYEEVALGINRWIRQHPDPEKGFVVVDRGQGTQGQLIE